MNMVKFASLILGCLFLISAFILVRYKNKFFLNIMQQKEMSSRVRNDVLIKIGNEYVYVSFLTSLIGIGAVLVLFGLEIISLK